MSNTTEQKEKKPSYKDITYLTSTGDEITVRRNLCSICDNYIKATEPHTACLRQIEQQNAMFREKQRQKSCMEQFGTILNAHEHQRRLYPNDSVNGAETYNHELRRIEEEKQAAHNKMIADRSERKRRLPYLQQQIDGLRRQVARDEEEEKRELEESKKEEQKQVVD